MTVAEALLADPDLAEIDRVVREVAPELDCEASSEMGGPGLGYGKFSYRYASGRAGETYKLGIMRRKHGFSLYCCGMDETGGYVAEGFRDRLPKASVGKSCVRFKRFSDLDPAVVRDLIRATSRSSYGQ